MNKLLIAEKSRGAADSRIVAAVLVVVLLIVAAAYLLWPREEVEPVPVPAPAQTPDTVDEPPPLQYVEPAKTKEERGDTAREVIAALKAAEGATDYAQAHARAQEYQAEERYADAQLLNFFAARAGYGPAAFDLGKSYDPNHFRPESGLMKNPDAVQAYRWYQQALDAGIGAAADHLAQLRTWAEEASRTGNVEAEQLLLQWE